MEKIASDGPKWSQEDVFFLLIQTLPTFWAERIRILRIFLFLIFFIPNFWISRSPDCPIPRSRLRPGLGGLGPARALLRRGSAVGPRWLPDHKVGEIQGTRTIPSERHQCKPCLGKRMYCNTTKPHEFPLIHFLPDCVLSRISFLRYFSKGVFVKRGVSQEI